MWYFVLRRFDMDLLLDRLRNLEYEEVSPAEILRQLKEKRPDLKKGEVLASAKRFVARSGTGEEFHADQKYLTGLFELEESYVSSAGPLGTCRDQVTIFQDVKKPLRFVPLMNLVICGSIGLLLYNFTSHDNIAGLFGIGAISGSLILGMERAVVFNKYEARKRLDSNIIRDAERLEAILEKVYPS